MRQTISKPDQPAVPENQVQPQIEKWTADTPLRFPLKDDTDVITHPREFLVAECGGDNLIVVSFLHHGEVIQKDMRLTFEEFMSLMPDGILKEVYRGVAISESRLSGVNEHALLLEFDDKYNVKLHHEKSRRALSKIGYSPKLVKRKKPEQPKDVLGKTGELFATLFVAFATYL